MKNKRSSNRSSGKANAALRAGLVALGVMRMEQGRLVV
jgi:hypothetical protein